MTPHFPIHFLQGRPFARVEKITARLCLLIVAAALCACSKTADLQSGLKDAEANEIIFVLDLNVNA